MALPHDIGGGIIQAMKPVKDSLQTITTGNASTAINSGVVRIIAAAGSTRIAIGPTGTTAGANDMLLIAEVAEYFAIDPGHVVAVTGGTIELSEME